MEEEAEKLKEMQGEVEKQMMSAKSRRARLLTHSLDSIFSVPPPLPPSLIANSFPTAEEKQEADLRSVYVGNVSI